MSVILRQPSNLNFLSPLGFKFVIHKTPNVDYMVQAVNVPSVQIGVFNQENPFVRIPRPGDHLNFGPLSIVFKIDERMLNYTELHNWFTAIGFPDNFGQAQSVYGSNYFEQNLKDRTGKGAYSNALLSVLDSNMTAIAAINFYDMFPIGISEITFDSRNPSVNYMEATCTFAYRKYSVEPVGVLTPF